METWREELYSKNELYHHGILGQKWGRRNGPPYPLDYSDHSAAEKKYLQSFQRKRERMNNKTKAQIEKLNTKKNKYLEKEKADKKEQKEWLKSGKLNKESNKEYSKIDSKINKLNKRNDFNNKVYDRIDKKSKGEIFIDQLISGGRVFQLTALEETGMSKSGARWITTTLGTIPVDIIIDKRLKG